MSKFIFKYKKILDIKIKHEDKVKLELSEAFRRLDNERATLEKLNRMLRQHMNAHRELTLRGCSCFEVRQSSDHIAYIREKIEYQKRIIESCLNDVEEVKKKLLGAMKEVKTFEKLKEKQFEEFVEAEKKSEALAIDEIVTYKNSTV